MSHPVEPRTSTSSTIMQPSAASKVFNIPELLENILIYLPKPYKDYTTREKHTSYYMGKVPHPLFQLFVLKRLNSTFKATIEGSRTCRRLMHLEPVSDTVKDRRVMMNWLLRDLGWTTHTTKQGRVGLRRLFDGGTWVSISKSLQATTAYFAQLQSWRAVAWHPATVSRANCVPQLFVTGAWEMIATGGTFGPDADLGELLNWYVTEMEKTYEMINEARHRGVGM
ncbi:hypothetical protein CLAFUW4_06634 [Fulvia fulva]|uniref:Uncharacterized protein n=1 Tax=Passalora fulva TaxID=5499 RepID=A0A9Q8UR63_PASFU|nr:uncharacterized protein CLAFUR5_06779 [Fulvia fulva]KAK4621867.1 hypothetical protein CLAFUR4_06642 [Fulvia fulva]KAK4623311.1 hypothetical protein CLAFUR0_06636 [Fulvia fulva]UJO19391.1 hypothetical protein CLAFUR5_06779 [Fulvia fulva]WPV16087.1 hypothetical protein CLAFUW4_06634 [Fulvia fulva]WPV31692.1 hypothetical protein CLAFUW7_06633 [Fulvia fulva]